MRTMDSARDENPFVSSDSTGTASAIARTAADTADSTPAWMRAMDAAPAEHRLDSDLASAEARPAAAADSSSPWTATAEQPRSDSAGSADPISASERAAADDTPAWMRDLKSSAPARQPEQAQEQAA